MGNVKVSIFFVLSFALLFFAIAQVEHSKALLDGGNLAIFTFINILILAFFCFLFRKFYLGDSPYKITYLFGIGSSVIVVGTLFLFYVIFHFDSIVNDLTNKNAVIDSIKSIDNLSDNFKLVCSVFIAAIYGSVGAGMMLSAITYRAS